MMLIMQLLVALGIGVVIYAVWGVFSSSGKPQPEEKPKIFDPPVAAEDSGKEQKIQRLQSQVAKLESQLEEALGSSGGKAAASGMTKEKEEEFTAELKRREEWVAKAEAELAKIKGENTDLNNKFMAKEKELEEEFTKNVNLTREARELKAALDAKEMACRMKEDQLQAQKHQLEGQAKSISEHLAAISEFNRKEKISEWVPKSEFNQLNAEYTKLEKELETSQERLKSFAVEIAHLRQAQDKKPTLAQEAAPKVEVPEDPKKEPKQEIMSLENSKPQPADIVQKTEETKEEQ
jgi:chromosome segregation ATPase